MLLEVSGRRPRDLCEDDLETTLALRLGGGGYVIGDDRVGRVRAGVGGIPDRHHDQGHDRDDERGSHDKLDHFRTAGVIVKLAQQFQRVSPPFGLVSNCELPIANLAFPNSQFATRNSRFARVDLALRIVM